MNKSKSSGRDFLREKVRTRDNHTCQSCGRVWDEKERRFDVHHTDVNIEGKNGKIYSNNKDMSKMVTLCHKCHMNNPQVLKKMRCNEGVIIYIKNQRNIGKTFEYIAKTMGCSHQNVQQLFKKYLCA